MSTAWTKSNRRIIIGILILTVLVLVYITNSERQAERLTECAWFGTQEALVVTFDQGYEELCTKADTLVLKQLVADNSYYSEPGVYDYYDGMLADDPLAPTEDEMYGSMIEEAMNEPGYDITEHGYPY